MRALDLVNIKTPRGFLIGRAAIANRASQDATLALYGTVIATRSTHTQTVYVFVAREVLTAARLSYIYSI